MLRLRFDSLQVGATPIEVRPGGSKVYEGIASYGDVVLDYGPMDPGGARSEFVPASTALDPEAVRLTEGIPFTILHPGDLLEADDEDAYKEHNEGSVLRAEADWSTTPPSLRVAVIVHTRSAQDDIESGRVRELSLGYDCDDEEASGVHDGKVYTVVQRRRRPNHLSGVPRARSRTADGRAARLDAAPGPVDITPTVDASTLARATTASHYAHLDAGAPMEDETENANTDAPEIVAETEAAVAADPAEALAAFSPEDAEVLKTLSPEGLAMLAKAVKQVKAEAAEQAVLAAPDVAAVIAPSDAPALEVESTESMVEEAGDDPDENDDATAPMASGGATPDLDAMSKMLSDMQAQLDAMRAGKPKSDAVPAPPSPVVVLGQSKSKFSGPATRTPKADAVAEGARLDAEKRKQADAAFVTAIKKQVGSRARLDSAADAAREALATIGHETPEVLSVARRAWDERRLDDLASLAAAADRKRRDVHLDAQGAAVAAVQSAEADYLARQLGDFKVPQRAVSGG